MKAGHFDRSGSWTSRNKNAVSFPPKFKSTANFSAPAQERNLFSLSERSPRKKIHNFPIKSSHLCRTSRQVWFSSSACDHCRTYQLFLHYDNWHLHDGCQGANDTSTRLLHCELCLHPSCKVPIVLKQISW